MEEIKVIELMAAIITVLFGIIYKFLEYRFKCSEERINQISLRSEQRMEKISTLLSDNNVEFKMFIAKQTELNNQILEKLQILTDGK